MVAFLSDRAENGVARLYLLPLDGGEARAVETPPGRVKHFAWSPDGGRIAFVRADDEPGEPDDVRGETAPAGDGEPQDVRSAEQSGAPGVAGAGQRAGKERDKGAPVVVDERPRYDRV